MTELRLQKRSLKIIQILEYSKKSLISLLLMPSTILTITMEKGQMLPRRLLTKSLVPLLQPIGIGIFVADYVGLDEENMVDS